MAYTPRGLAKPFYWPGALKGDLERIKAKIEQLVPPRYEFVALEDYTSLVSLD